MSKKDDNINNLKQRAKNLEDMLFDKSTEEVIKGMQVQKGDGTFPPTGGTKALNYDVVKAETDKKAAEIVESVILLYLPVEFVNKHEYVFQKMEVDKLTVSNLIFQMKTAEHAIKKLLEEIDNGSTRDRTFEVLSSLQKSKMEIVKHLAQFMVILENNYKNLKIDYYTNIAESQPEQLESGEETMESHGTRFRGTKALMSAVEDYLEEEKTRQSEKDFEEVERTEESDDTDTGEE